MSDQPEDKTSQVPTIPQEIAEVMVNQTEQVKSTVQDTNSQLDQDRADIDMMKVGVGQVKLVLEAVLQNLGDFRQSIRQVVKDTIKDEVSRVVKAELNRIILENPGKVYIVKSALFERIFLKVTGIFEKGGK